MWSSFAERLLALLETLQCSDHAGQGNLVSRLIPLLPRVPSHDLDLRSIVEADAWSLAVRASLPGDCRLA